MAKAPPTMARGPMTPAPRPMQQQPYSQRASRDRRDREMSEDREEDDPRVVDGRGADREDPDGFAEFLEAQDKLPYIPDTDDWHFFWARSRIGNETDGKNLGNKLNSRLLYSIVTTDDLRLIPDAPDLRMHVKKSPMDEPWIQLGDMVLLKCPMSKWLRKKEAEQYLATEQRGQPTRDARAVFRRKGKSIFYEPDYEDDDRVENVGIRQTSPGRDVRRA